MSSSARAAQPPVLEVGCYVKTLRCVGPEAARRSRELGIAVSAYTAEKALCFSQSILGVLLVCLFVFVLFFWSC